MVFNVQMLANQSQDGYGQSNHKAYFKSDAYGAG
jgi:hypothetical protein